MRSISGIVKNSWAATWGIRGYIHLARNNCGRSGECGLLSDASYPIAGASLPSYDELPDVAQSAPEEERCTLAVGVGVEADGRHLALSADHGASGEGTLTLKLHGATMLQTRVALKHGRGRADFGGLLPTGKYSAKVEFDDGLGCAEQSVTVTAAPVCSDSQYCCPDAKHCLTATKTSCLKDASVCAAGEACCPVTKLCVKVGKPCNTTCHVAGNKWGISDYCSPTQTYKGFDSHWCATPTDPGVLCSTDDDCKNRKWTTAVCDKVTSECVTIREACQLP